MKTTATGCECHPGPAAGTVTVTGSSGTTKELTYANVGSFAVFEGDIILCEVEESGGGAELEGVAITGLGTRWEKATIAFEVAASLPSKQRVTDAIEHWHSRTAIRFVPRTPANADSFPDFVRFRPSSGGCSSSVGRVGGAQTINIGAGCSTGNVIHEIGHTVGLWHEQSREDRAKFVEIRSVNVDPALLHNFDQHIRDGEDLGGYDYGSIMHYPRTAFSTNGQDTIVPRRTLPAGVVMGQRVGLSAGDIAAVAQMYSAVQA